MNDLTITSSSPPVGNAKPGSSTSRQRTILYEAHNLMLSSGTGIATYSRELARAAGRLGHNVDGLFGVERGLTRGDHRLNEVLAFDAIDNDRWLSALEVAWRNICYPFAALGGLRPMELPRSGLVMGPMEETLRPFRRVFVATKLIETAIAQFKIYGRPPQLRLPDRPDVFHATHPVPLTLKGCPNIYTIHDLVPLRLPYTTLDNKKYFYRLLTTLARTADHIVTVSEYSKRDIVEHLGIDARRVTNTYQSVDIPPELLTRSDDEVAADVAKFFGLEFGGYFLFYGAIEPKKNVARLVDAYAASGSKLPLILASGGGWQNRVELRKIRDERFITYRIDGDVVRRQRQVRRLDYLPRDQLLTLIRGARALLFPSIYEGFGLPVIEAMALGTPVVTSDGSSLTEIAGDAALLVDPYSIDSIAWAIRAIEADSDLREELVERGLRQAKKFLPSAYDERLRQLYERF